MSATSPVPQSVIDEFVGVAHGDFQRLQELLVEYPAVLNGDATWHETAIEAAAQMGRVDIVEYLLAAGAPLDICTAAMLGRRADVAAALDADPGAAHATGAHGIPVLYYPAIANHPAIAEDLLARGAEVNAGAGGNTPLHGAAMFGQPEMAAWLLAHGADPAARDYNGKTPLEVALDSNQAAVADLLRAHSPAPGNEA
jgi:ankyrin repeat protein